MLQPPTSERLKIKGRGHALRSQGSMGPSVVPAASRDNAWTQIPVGAGLSPMQGVLAVANRLEPSSARAAWARSGWRAPLVALVGRGQADGPGDRRHAQGAERFRREAQAAASLRSATWCRCSTTGARDHTVFGAGADAWRKPCDVLSAREAPDAGADAGHHDAGGRARWGVRISATSCIAT